jgi:hypothetical protein
MGSTGCYNELDGDTMRHLALALSLASALVACSEPYSVPDADDLTVTLEMPQTPTGTGWGAIYRTGYAATDTGDCAAHVGPVSRARLLLDSTEWWPAADGSQTPWAVATNECVVLFAHHAEPGFSSGVWCTGGQPIYADGSVGVVLPSIQCGPLLDPAL